MSSSIGTLSEMDSTYHIRCHGQIDQRVAHMQLVGQRVERREIDIRREGREKAGNGRREDNQDLGLALVIRIDLALISSLIPWRLFWRG